MKDLALAAFKAIVGYLIIAAIVVGSIALATRAEGQKITTCESVILEVDGVFWKFPNNWINGQIICYDGPQDESTHVITIERRVTFKGSRKALEQIGLAP